MQILPYWMFVLPGLCVWEACTYWLLAPLFSRYKPAFRPFDIYKSIPLVTLFLAGFFLCAYLPIPQHKVAYCCYWLSAATLLPFGWFLLRTPLPRIKYTALLCFVLLAGGLTLYTFPLRDYIVRTELGGQSMITLFNAMFAPSNQITLEQPESVRKLYQQIQPPEIPFNVLVIVNDTLRARNLGAYGYQRWPDKVLQPFYDKSYIFQYALSPAYFTIASMAMMFSSLGPQHHPVEIKKSRRMWDFASKDMFTFYILSANKYWSSMHKYIDSFNMQHLWSASNDGGLEELLDFVPDEPAVSYAQQLIKKHPRYMGVLHTHGTHFPYFQNPALKPYYKPCSSSNRNSWPQASINCYDNAIVQFVTPEAELLKNIDLSNTVVVFTADHGDAFYEHNAYFHATLHDEVLHVPFIWYIPPSIKRKIPAEQLHIFEENLNRYVSTLDILPTVLHLASLLTGQPPAYNEQDFSGRSLFTKRDNNVIVSSGCLVDLVCPKRDVTFADDNYFVLLKPNQLNPLEIYAAKDLAQKEPIPFAQVDPKRIENIYRQAPSLHPLGGVLHGLLKQNITQLKDLSPNS